MKASFRVLGRELFGISDSANLATAFSGLLRRRVKKWDRNFQLEFQKVTPAEKVRRYQLQFSHKESIG